MSIHTQTANNKRLAELLSSAFSLAASIVSQTADAHDVNQDAATTALTHTSAPSQNSQEFTPWFYKVVRNKAIDKVRGDSRAIARTSKSDLNSNSSNESSPCALETLMADERQNPDANMQQSQAQQMLFEALSKINIEHREIVLLKDYYGFAYAEIASILGIEKGTVMSRLHRARQALQQKLLATQTASM